MPKRLARISGYGTSAAWHGRTHRALEGSRLAFALLLKYFTQQRRFPRGRAEFPDEVVDYVAKQTNRMSFELAGWRISPRPGKRTMAASVHRCRGLNRFRVGIVADLCFLWGGSG
ncbi:DUF4158 domain-containing protein [Spongiactinospora sp. 9N601]|uniref:DUF4158 domain-containing protein n=1 Tax=Spongiactinospora sp. 9N601 TaxID=3375149 RepID=UPI0037B2444A